jgi:aminopeptidase N
LPEFSVTFNTPINSLSYDESSQKYTAKFHPTPVMSTYLLELFISEYDMSTSGISDQGVLVRIGAPVGLVDLGVVNYALNASMKAGV